MTGPAVHQQHTQQLLHELDAPAVLWRLLLLRHIFLLLPGLKWDLRTCTADRTPW